MISWIPDHVLELWIQNIDTLNKVITYCKLRIDVSAYFPKCIYSGNTHIMKKFDIPSIYLSPIIGKVKAARKLEDKMKKDFGDIEVDQMNSISYNTVKQEALVALTTLGFNKAAAEKSIDRIIRKEGNEVTLESVIKQALKTA